MKGSAVAALIAIAATACGRTDLVTRGATPSPVVQGVRTPFPISSTGPLDFVSPCNGELVVGLSATVGEGQVLTDGAGGTHIRAVFRTSGTYTGQSTGLTYTESGTGHSHVNLPRSGAVNEVLVLNGQFRGSDGSTVVFRDRLVLVVSANGEVRVDRRPSDTGSLRCR